MNKTGVPALESFAPLFKADQYTRENRHNLSPFFTNLDRPVYAPLIVSPELVGALCSRASRASDDLRRVFYDEFLVPFLNPERDKKETAESWEEKRRYAESLRAFIAFSHKHSLKEIFANP